MAKEVIKMDTAIKFLYLSEPDMVRAGVTDMDACVEAMEEDRKSVV